MISFNGVTKCKTDWANDLGIKLCSLSKRISKYGVEIALAPSSDCDTGQSQLGSVEEIIMDSVTQRTREFILRRIPK